ncbi:MAG: formate--tetrahydrofolate ligase [Candidatus Methanoplasma sp.]|jgi:formate--tetrahydrofolate ligase|nr:formate--tetrahydrofolate ligase [Candidatus Methanoplasma sp.]
MKDDIQIGEEASVRNITEVAASVGLKAEDLDQYGKYTAKVPLDVLSGFDGNKDGKLIMVTAVTPTPAGEGKTVTTIGLIQGLGRIGKKVVGALREPSVGPTFGVKGGATGGGYSQVYPMWDIDLHFTGDIHAVSSAHNLLSAILENSMVRDNPLKIDPSRIILKKAVDMNCRELRSIVVGLGGGKSAGGVTHESGFLITSASEISAILALSAGYEDLRERMEKMVVAYTYSGDMVTVRDLGCVGAMMVLLKDAIKPNLVQTLEGQPVFVHGFPFANIAHGNNSILATKYAMKLGDYAVTEAGFAADLGGEKFMDIVCRQAGISPDCVVIVASVRALMTHGGAKTDEPETFTREALTAGLSNLDKHIENVRKYGIPVIVSINHFSSDDPEHMQMLRDHCTGLGAECVRSDAFAEGGKGAEELARKVVEVINRGEKNFRFLYDDGISLKGKIETIASEIYGADGVTYSGPANRTLKDLEAKGFGKLPICIAKTQYSLSDNADLKGAPKGWKLGVREVTVSAGAGFVVPICGSIMLMPGLSGTPSAMRMDLTAEGKIRGLK